MTGKNPPAPSPQSRKKSPVSETDAKIFGIANAAEGKEYLDQTCMISPAGDPATLDGLAGALFTAAKMINETLKRGQGKHIMQTVASVAYVLREMQKPMDEERLRDIVERAVSRCAPKGSDNFLAPDAVNATLENMKQSATNLETAVRGMTKTIGTLTDKITQTAGPGDIPRTYRDVLMDPTPGSHVDPRILAKEGIRTRQLKISLGDTNVLRETSDTVLKERMNAALECKGKVARITRNQALNEIIIETDTQMTADWLRSKGNLAEFLTKTKLQGNLVPRTLNLIALNVPIVFEPTCPKQKEEFLDVNCIDNDKVTKMKWVKPADKRRKDQVSAHLLITTNDKPTAHKLTTHGAIICGRRIMIEKCKVDPLRCFNCQDYGHKASECDKPTACGTCGKGHKTNECNAPMGTTWCVSCNVETHASWDRKTCPTFIKKAEEYDRRNPDNLLPYFPDNKLTWTWTTNGTSGKRDTRGKTGVGEPEKPTNPGYTNENPTGRRWANSALPFDWLKPTPGHPRTTEDEDWWTTAPLGDSNEPKTKVPSPTTA